MTVKPQLLVWATIAQAVREVVPDSIYVYGRQDAFRPLVTVTLRPASVVARLVYRGARKRRVLAAACAATASSPAGVMVRVEWR